ncbi:hypothetical protein SAMN05192555_101295 [Franzmannia pantelleriensis]|uniref:Uncharacterized protein n=1 Tax=Franzmannia pantelleriensis TaxID=48727 RepID=A0A1G9F3M1_9GAMM|nr:hypothetical protein [Halomonas pantelleriensis]SDK82930.1 hypothetical protein SAMN05192555_101295 [Halomonas pantelleriensis]
MAERPEDQRLSSPIVPDVNASLTADHLRHPRSTRLWPLWLMVVVLIAGLAGLAFAAWQERLALQRELDRLEGQLSNVHARFDGFDDEQDDELEPITERLGALGDGQQALRDRLEEQEQLIESIRVASAEDEAVAQLASQFESLSEDMASLESLVGVVRQSLDALEEGGEQARAALDSRLERIETRVDEQAPILASLDDEWHNLEPQLARLEEEQQALAARLDQQPELDPQRLEQLSDDLAALEVSLDQFEAEREDDRQALTELRESLTSTRAELTELRQSQLATSAQLEVLQSQLGN